LAVSIDIAKNLTNKTLLINALLHVIRGEWNLLLRGESTLKEN